MSDDAAEKFLAALRELSTRLSARIAVIASAIATDPDGNIVSSPDNIALVGALVSAMKEQFVDDEYVDAVLEYIETLDESTQAVIERFADFPDIPRDVLDAIADRYKQETRAYLTDPDSFTESLWTPIVNGLILGAAIGAPINTALSSVVDITANAPIASDVEAVTVSAPLMLERTQTAAAAEEVGAKFFLFQGRPIKTTRDWCREREGKYWHIEEIKEWGRQAAQGNGWDGMVEGTNEQTIFVHLGGWFGERNSCRHVLVPVLRSAVPDEDLDRMRKNGLI